jgi:hypothetical protein
MTELQRAAHEVRLRQFRLEVLDDEDRVWKQAVHVEQMRAGGRDVESAQRQLETYRGQLKQARERLRREEQAIAAEAAESVPAVDE